MTYLCDEDILNIVTKWKKKSPFFVSNANQIRLENQRSHFDKKTRLWDSLPYFNKQKNLSDIENDIYRLSKYYAIEPNSITKDDFSALALHWFKFNFSLIDTLDLLTKKYCLNDRSREGNTDAIFGIPGSGKTTFATTIKSKSSNNIVIMESSDIRYHLFAKKIINLEEKYTQDFDQCKSKIESPAVTVMLLSILNWSARILNKSGYDAVYVNNEFVLNANKVYAHKKYFIDHRFVSLSLIEKMKNLGQDSETIRNIFQHGAKSLPESMHQMWRDIANSQDIPRWNYDSYPWNDAIEITDFEKMNTIFRSCRPSATGLQLHGLYSRGNKTTTANPYDKMIKISNPNQDELVERQNHLWNQYIS